MFLHNTQDSYSRILKPVNEFAVITTCPHRFVWFMKEEICEFLTLGTALSEI
jgi:hypothetical protein